jgi:transcriptional regulator with XRE-family HTH domain
MNKSQKEFAQMMGVSPQLASKWLKGNVNFTLETISKIETVFGISLINVGTQDNLGNMVMAMLNPIHDAYQKPKHAAEEHATKTSKVIQLNNVYGGFSIAN